MTDPTFTTRAELAAWVKQRIRYPDPRPLKVAQLDALADIKRVTLAHMHLMETPK